MWQRTFIGGFSFLVKTNHATTLLLGLLVRCFKNKEVSETWVKDVENKEREN